MSRVERNASIVVIALLLFFYCTSVKTVKSKPYLVKALASPAGSQCLRMVVIKTSLKIRRAAASGLGMLSGSLVAFQGDGTRDVQMQVELPLLPQDDVEALPAPVNGLVGPGVFLQRGLTEWTISMGHGSDNPPKQLELHIEVSTESPVIRDYTGGDGTTAPHHESGWLRPLDGVCDGTGMRPLPCSD